MDKVRYMISDAASMVNVETHVLRYWEEELDLTIPRNEMGHRYYTRENIEEFKKIKELKEQGHQLKAIKMILHGGQAEQLAGLQGTLPNTSVPNMPVSNMSVSNMSVHAPAAGTLSSEERMEQFRELMCDIVGHAIALNNEELSQQIGIEVQERILKEMNYLMREQEDAQEQRYKKLDAAIRGNIHKKVPLFQKKEKPKKQKDILQGNPVVN